MTDQNQVEYQPPAPKSEGALLPIEQHRAIQEVQAAMIIAKKFPRDQAAAYARIMKACERPSLAENAMYAYPKGGSPVTGPSIRLAEVLVQNWGNVDFGIKELSQSKGGSEVEAFAWDMETNVKQTKVFKVPHVRRKDGRNIDLSDPRDIYEMVANLGARRMRACILGIIPGDIVDAAIKKCEKTLASGEKPIEDRINDMLTAFEEHGVTADHIEKRLGHNTESIAPIEIVTLQKIFISIRDGMSKAGDWFELAGADADGLGDKIKESEKTETKLKPPVFLECPEDGCDFKTEDEEDLTMHRIEHQNEKQQEGQDSEKEPDQESGSGEENNNDAKDEQDQNEQNAQDDPAKDLIDQKNQELLEIQNFIAEFKNLGKGFPTYTFKNLKRLSAAPQAVKEAHRMKWGRLIQQGTFEEARWPLDIDLVQDVDNESGESENDGGLSGEARAEVIKKIGHEFDETEIFVGKRNLNIPLGGFPPTLDVCQSLYDKLVDIRQQNLM